MYQYLNKFKMWSTSNKTRKNIWKFPLNVLRKPRILWKSNMESLLYQNRLKHYQYIMHKNKKMELNSEEAYRNVSLINSYKELITAKQANWRRI